MLRIPLWDSWYSQSCQIYRRNATSDRKSDSSREIAVSCDPWEVKKPKEIYV